MKDKTKPFITKVDEDDDMKGRYIVIPIIGDDWKEIQSQSKTFTKGSHIAPSTGKRIIETDEELAARVKKAVLSQMKSKAQHLLSNAFNFSERENLIAKKEEIQRRIDSLGDEEDFGDVLF